MAGFGAFLGHPVTSDQHQRKSLPPQYPGVQVRQRFNSGHLFVLQLERGDKGPGRVHEMSLSPPSPPPRRDNSFRSHALQLARSTTATYIVSLLESQRATSVSDWPLPLWEATVPDQVGEVDETRSSEAVKPLTPLLFQGAGAAALHLLTLP